MLAYVTVGTNDLEAAGAFYDALLAEVGATRAMENDRLIAWTTAPGQPMFIVIKPFNGEQATVGNGNMAALAASSKEQVNALHKRRWSLAVPTKAHLVRVATAQCISVTSATSKVTSSTRSRWLEPAAHVRAVLAVSGLLPRALRAPGRPASSHRLRFPPWRYTNREHHGAQTRKVS